MHMDVDMDMDMDIDMDMDMDIESHTRTSVHWYRCTLTQWCNGELCSCTVVQLDNSTNLQLYKCTVVLGHRRVGAIEVLRRRGAANGSPGLPPPKKRKDVHVCIYIERYVC